MTTNEIKKSLEFAYKTRESRITHTGENLTWIKLLDLNSTAILQSETIGGVYYVISSSETVKGYPTDTFVLSRNYEDDFNEGGYVGEYQGQIGICCGFALACAIGYPSQCLKTDPTEIYEMAEKDYKNLKEGKDIVLIDKLLRKPSTECAPPQE